MDGTTTFITIIAGLFASLNIFQFIFWKATKRKYNAEASKAEVEAAQGCFDLRQDQFTYINNQLDKLQKDYCDLAEKYRSSMIEHIAEINGKCEEIRELKGEIARLQKIVCYCTDCQNRQSTPKNKCGTI